VLLDAGNTLVFVDPRRVVPVLVGAGAHRAEALWRDAEREARLTLSLALGRERRETADGSEGHVWLSYFDTIIRRCGIDEAGAPAVAETLKKLHERDHMWTWVQEGAPDALTRVRELGYRVGVVSNADGRVEALFDRVGLTPYVEFVIDSHTVGVAKPDPRIFRMGADRLGVAAEQCLYVGDLYAVDVLGARAAGLRPLLLDPFERHADWQDVDRIRTVVELPGWLETHR
jgi:putative hydrolase of the HAD superfamily